MNNQLFNEIYQLLDFNVKGESQSKANSISIEALFNYFVYGEYTYTPECPDDDNYIAYKKDEKEILILPKIGIKEYKNVYQRINNIPTKFLHAFTVSDNEQSLSRKINGLLEKYHLNIDTNYKTNIINLLNYCFSEKLFPDYKKYSLKSNTIKHTYGFEDAVVKLEDFLYKNSKVIISEVPGSGKTHFIKYFLTLCCQNNNLPYGWKQTFKDVYYIEYNGDIKCSLQTISTLKNYESQDDFSSVCDFSNSLLVIDCMYYRENFEDDLEYLSSLPFKIIVITHSGNNNIAGFCRFPFFPKLTDTDLISIFMTYGKLNNNKEVIQKNWPRIKSLTCNNPLIISLLAKQYLALNLNPDSESLNRVLSILEETNTKKDMNKVFKHNNDTANMAGHIRKIFINLIEKIAPDKNANYIFIAACISYFGWEKIPLSFLKKVIHCVSDFDESIQFLIQSGILSSDHISVQMPVLIVYSLQYYTISKSNDSDISYKSIIQLSQNLNNYLDNLSDKEFYLGNILFHFVKNLYGKIKETNNPNQLSTSKNFELWQILLQKICLYYHDYGNFKAEESVSELFRFPDGIQNKSSKLNQNIIKLESFLYQCRNPGTDEFAKTLTDYIDSIDQLISTELLEDIKNLYQIDNSSSHNLSTSFTHKYYGFSIVLRNLVDMNINLFFYTQFYETEPNCEIKEGKINWSHTIQTNPNFNLYPALKTLFPNNCGTDYQMRYYDFTSKIVYEKKSLHNDITIQKNISYYMTEAFYGKSRIEKEFLLRGCAVSLYALFFKIPTRRFRSPQELKIYVNNQMSRFEQGINYCYNISHETFRICYFILHLVSFCLLYYFKLPLDCKKYIENLSKKCPYITYAKDNTFQLLE